MLKNIALLITAFVCAQVFAEPMKMASKSELASAKKAAEGLLTSGVSADQVFEYAEEAKKSAEKYQLYCTAFKLYAKEEKAEEAAKVIDKIQSEFRGVPDKDIVSMIEQYAKKLAKENEELGAALSVSKMRVSAASQLSKAKKELKKNPNSVEQKYLIAESHAVLGDWKSALKQFKDAGGSVWQIANEEASGIVSAKTAAFWWDYKPRSKFNAEPAFKAHSAALYEKLLKDGELSILEKATAESRIEKAGQLGATKPKSELDKLKKICNTNGLIHCWRFNGDLKDCISSTEAFAAHATPILKEGQVHFVEGGGCHVCLGEKIVPLDGTEFTIELWATHRNLIGTSRIFTLGDHRNNATWVTWSYQNDINQCETAIRWNPGTGSRRTLKSPAPFSIGVEYHIAVVYQHEGDNWVMTVYKQDNKTGKSLSHTKIYVKDAEWSPRLFSSGRIDIGNDWTGGPRPCASYNEVRIWNRALSEEELTQNAIKFHKAGETMKK